MKPFSVGLTGGLGSGKTAVAALFERRGVTVIDSDEIARELTRAGGIAIEPIRAAFGTAFIGTDGALDRTAMRKLVFTDPRARLKIESILHPLIRDESTRRSGRATGAYVILVVPLLVESGADRSRYSRVLVVDCTEAQQIERVKRRSGLSEAEVRDILSAQTTRERRLAQADDVIDNSGSPDALEQQVALLHEKYLGLAAKSAQAS